MFIIRKQLVLLKREIDFALEGAAEYYRPTIANLTLSCEYDSAYEAFSLSKS